MPNEKDKKEEEAAAKAASESSPDETKEVKTVEGDEPEVGDKGDEPEVAEELTAVETEPEGPSYMVVLGPVLWDGIKYNTGDILPGVSAEDAIPLIKGRAIAELSTARALLAEKGLLLLQHQSILDEADKVASEVGMSSAPQAKPVEGTEV